MWHKHHLHLLQKMRKRGWSEDELTYAHSVLVHSHHKKSTRHKIFDYLVIWFSFIAIIFGNLFAMIALTPLVVLFPNPGIYAMLLILGVAFGFLFTVVIEDVQHLFSGQHHYFVYVLIPYFAIIGAILIMGIAAKTLPNLYYIPRKPWLMGVVYAISFLLPYILQQRLKAK